MALLFTIILQQREIHAAKKAADDLQKERLDDRLISERMQFENTFFQMLAIHNTIVNSIDVDRGPSKNQLRGRECFKHFRDQMLVSYNSNSLTDELQKSLSAHDDLWKSYQNDLARYYRYLYNIIRFINESNVSKIRYIRILRAQLSDFELLVLFYNGLFPLAAKFKEYVEFFTLFDNLPKDLLFNRSHEDFYAASAFDEKRRRGPYRLQMIRRRPDNLNKIAKPTSFLEASQMNTKSLKSILREMPTREDMKDVLAKLADESDTTLAIVGATLVETALRMSLRVRMYSDLTRADEISLFEGDGPLATFSSKIRIGFAFEAVDDAMRDELDRLRTITRLLTLNRSFHSSCQLLGRYATNWSCRKSVQVHHGK